MVTYPLTYDPVVDVRPLRRGRLPDPAQTPAQAPAPPPGRALVLVSDTGPALTVLPGEQVPDTRLGGYRDVVTVDTTEHRLVLELPLPARDSSASFRCRVELSCRVTDPAAVVARGIRDMSEMWHGPVREKLLDVSRSYGMGQARTAEAALAAALRDVTGDTAVRLRGTRVELLAPDAPSAAAASHRSRVRGTRRDDGALQGGAGTGARTDISTAPTSEAPTSEADEPRVLIGEVVARKEEPLRPPATSPAQVPPPPPHRPSRVRGTASADDVRRDGGRGRAGGA